MMLVCFVSLFFKCCFCELIVDSYDKVTPELLEREAKLVETIEEYPDPLCQDIKEIHKTYEVNLKNKDVEETETFTITAQIENDTTFERQHSNTIPIFIRKLLTCYEQDNQKLIKSLRENYIESPSTEPHDIPVISEIVLGNGLGEYHQDEILDKLLFQGKVKNGFFIEAGAWDFVHTSNTLWFEVKHNWTGLLIEPYPMQYERGRKTNRKAFSSCSCLSTKTRPR